MDTSSLDRMATLVMFRSRAESRRKPKSTTQRTGPCSHLLTRTCGKIGVIDDRWVPPEGFEIPGPDEWWMVHIVHETRPGVNQGCLIMRPVVKIDADSRNALLPGFYTSSQPNPGTLLVTPKHDANGNWYLPLKLKNELMHNMGLALIVVNLGGAYWRDGDKEGQKLLGHGHGPGDHNQSPRDIVRNRIREKTLPEL